jgi:hypothetical protein
MDRLVEYGIRAAIDHLFPAPPARHPVLKLQTSSLYGKWGKHPKEIPVSRGVTYLPPTKREGKRK